MDSFDANHEETRTDIPLGPVATDSPWSLLTWGLPATVLSMVSMFVFWVVLAWLNFQRLWRIPFQLPFSPIWLAGPAAALAWYVTVRCGRRPGGHLPRIWALVLALMATACVGLASTSAMAGAGWLHALVVAALAAALILTIRLFRLRPSSHLVKIIGPLCLLGVLVFVLPPVSWLSSEAAAIQEQRVDERIRYLRFWTSEVQMATAYDWSRVMESPDLAREQIERLEAIPSEQLLGDDAMWRAATRLQRDDELARAGRSLIDAVTAAIDPGITPKTSALNEPAAWDDPVAGRRVKSLQFPRMSDLAGDYHREIGRIFQALESRHAGVSPRHLELGIHYQNRSLAFGDALKGAADNWTDQWLVSAMPNQAGLGEREAPLASLLGVSLHRRDKLAPADLWRMLRFSLARSRALASQKNGCYGQRYDRDQDGFFRLDCYAYRAADRGAEVRVEMRLVYGGQNLGALAGKQFPSALFFYFPLAGDTDETVWPEEAMGQLAAAVRTSWNGSLQAIDGASIRNGFVMQDGGSEIRVESGGLEPYDDQRKAAVVRARLIS